MTEKFVVTGMTCAACAAHVEKAASSLDGVDSAAVNLMLGTLVCSYDADRVTPQAIITAVEAAGYGAAPADDAKRDIRREQEESARAMGRRLLWSVVCLVPLFYLSMGHMMGLPVPGFMHRQPLLAAVVQLALCLPILILNRAYFTWASPACSRAAPTWTRWWRWARRRDWCTVSSKWVCWSPDRSPACPTCTSSPPA